ncbi:MAG: HAD family phosphatase [Acidimicrobiales bacterium]
MIFDFGGVVISEPFGILTARVGGQLAREAAMELLLGPYERDTDHVWHRVERGEATMAEWVTYVEEEARSRGLTVDWSALQRGVEAIVVHDVVVDRIRALRADGYLMGLLTNNIKEGSGTWRALVPVDELFDVVVDSSVVGIRKPDPRIYAMVLEHLGGIDPGRAVFLDDHPGNVEGARRAGIASVLVDDPAEAIADLDALLTGGQGGDGAPT